jgi:signal transduction histidine kinase
MRQVVLNLVGNALAATGSGGSIRVETRRVGDRAVLRVRDTGRGIAPEDLPRVFDPFFSRTEGGTGLGLSIVHGIVERHGGRIVLDSRIDHGTTARVEIPATRERCREPFSKQPGIDSAKTLPGSDEGK